MPSKTLKILTGALLLCSVGVVIENATTATDTTLGKIAQYRQWTRVTEKPIAVMNLVAGGD
ncbi:MAG TPA: hypothetical protein VGN90_04710 [Pyrinomonadaceae bacterium]|jgi:hypothetical protein|nr:hypothetical protein [Pyrinomonadaceae bacterium]